MNCPLCGEELEQAGHCPNCGEADWMEPESTSKALPGIFYENLAASREEEAQEHQAPRQPRYTPGERRGLFLSVLLLLAILLVVWLGCRQYDPNATAMWGNEGIAMDNRTFAIYYRSAVAELQSQYSQQNAQLPFDPSGNLERQYINLDEGYLGGLFPAKGAGRCGVDRESGGPGKSCGIPTGFREDRCL